MAATKANLSQRQTLRFMAELRHDVKVQAHLREDLAASNQLYADVFTCELVNSPSDPAVPVPIVRVRLDLVVKGRLEQPATWATLLLRSRLKMCELDFGTWSSLVLLSLLSVPVEEW